MKATTRLSVTKVNNMSSKQKRFILSEDEIPHKWYNIAADMPNKPMPPLNPATKEPLKPEDLYPIFAEEVSRQELNQTDAWIGSLCSDQKFQF